MSESKEVNQKSSNGLISNSKTWVMLAPESVISINSDTANIVKLRHPRSKKTAMFLFSAENSSVMEIMTYAQEKGSWFINDTVKQDGNLHLATPVDPLFLALPYLIEAKKNGKTLPLEDLFVDEDFPESCRICNCDGLSHLPKIADQKGGKEINAWSYNEEKTLRWLTLKNDNIVKTLRKEHFPEMNGAAVSKSFVMSTKLKECDDLLGFQQYACGLLSEYLPSELSQKLRQHMNLPEEDSLKRKSSDTCLTAKRSKLDIIGQGVPSQNDNSKAPKSKSTP